MSITERLANLSTPTVIITVLVLFAIRYLLLKYYKTPVGKSIAETAESLGVAMALVFLIIRPFLVQAFFIPSASMHPTLLEHDHILVNKLLYRFREPRLRDVIVFRSPPEADDTHQERDYIKRVIAVPGDTVRITPGYIVVGEQQYGHDELNGALAGYKPVGGDGKVKLFNDGVFVDGRLVSKAEVAAAVGASGKKVKIFPGVVYLNGKALKESYTAEDPARPYPDPGGSAKVSPDKWVVVDKQHNRVVKIPKGKLLVMGDNRNDSNDARIWGLLDRDRIHGKAMFVFWPINRIRWIR